MTPCEIKKTLQAPFPADQIEWRVGSTNQEKTKGLALAYVTNRAIQNRLDEVFGVFGWKNEFKEWKQSSQICGISVFDDEKKEWITKWDGADDSQTEAVKGGLSDAMKRAAYQWGIGRYLYNLESVWVPIKPCGRSFMIAGNPPALPAWALPEGGTSFEEIWDGPPALPIWALPEGTQQQPAKNKPQQNKPPTPRPKTNGNGKPNWTAFWPHMREIDADKEFVNLQAAICFNLNGPVESLTDFIKSQEDLDLLDKYITNAVFARDNSGGKLPGEGD